MTRLTIAIGLLIATSSVTAAPTDYIFDSVSKFDLQRDRASITGVLQGSTTPITVTWNEATNSDLRYHLSRCVPVFLTMLEKPGRYLLNLTIEPPPASLGTINCGLELKI